MAEKRDGWWSKSIVVSCLIQAPTKENPCTTYHKLFAIGRGAKLVEGGKNLWYHRYREFKLGALVIRINYAPHYYD